MNLKIAVERFKLNAFKILDAGNRSGKKVVERKGCPPKRLTGKWECELLTLSALNVNIFDMLRISVVLFSLLFIVSTASSDIFKYIDENGVTCYTDAPAGKKNQKVAC